MGLAALINEQIVISVESSKNQLVSWVKGPKGKAKLVSPTVPPAIKFPEEGSICKVKNRLKDDVQKLFLKFYKYKRKELNTAVMA